MQNALEFLTLNHYKEFLTTHINTQQRTVGKFHIVFLLYQEQKQINLIRANHNKSSFVLRSAQENNLHYFSRYHKFFPEQDVPIIAPSLPGKDYLLRWMKWQHIFALCGILYLRDQHHIEWG